MLSTFTRRHGLVAILLGVVCFAFAESGQAGDPPTPTGKKAFAPFDLTYLPGPASQGIVALRPAEIARHLPASPLGGQTRLFLGLVLAQLTACNLEAADTPALADLDECALGLSLSATFPTAKEQGKFMFGAGSPGCLRTVKPFDWTGAARKWFPKAEKAEYAGRAYLRTPWKLTSPLLPAELVKGAKGRYLGIFVPDGRTVAIGDEEQIHGLIDRLKEGKAADEPPGWHEVKRDLIAAVLDQRQVPSVHGTWPEKPAEIKPARVLVESVQVFAFGAAVQDGPGGGRVVGRVVAATKDAPAAGQAAKAIEELWAALRTALPSQGNAAAVVEPARMLHGILDSGKLSQDGQTVRGRIEVPVQFLHSFAAAAAAREKAETGELAPPPSMPGSLPPPPRGQ